MTMANSTAPSPQRSSASVSLRKTNKPLMEKRRRARINDSLTQLKSLVIQSSKKDSSQFNKLEKADILELTVKHLRNLQNQQQQQMAQVASTDPNLAGKYCAGFMECAQEVIRYLKQSQGFSDDTKARVVGHLTSCLQLASQPYAKPAPLPATAVVASNVMGTVSNSSTAQLANGHVIQIVSNPFQNCKQPALTTVNQYSGPTTVQVAVPVSSAPLQIPVFQQQQPSAVDLPSQTSVKVASTSSAVSASVPPASGTLSNVTSQIQDTSSYIRYAQPLHIQIPPVLSPFLVKADSSSQEPRVMRKHEEPKNNSNPPTGISDNISSSTASPSPILREVNPVSRPAQKQLQFYNGNDLQDHFCSRSRTYSVTSSSSSSSESEMSSPLNLSQSPTYSSSSTGTEPSREHSQLRFHSMSSAYGLDKISSAPHSSVKDNVDYCHSNFTSVIVDGRRTLEAPTSKYMAMMEDDRHCIRPHGTPSPASSVGEERLWRPW